MLINRFGSIALTALILPFLIPHYSIAAPNRQFASLIIRVVDVLNAPLASVRVTLYARDGGARLGAITDRTGTAQFQNLASGEYLLEAAADGFVSPDVSRIRLTPDQLYELSLTMKLAGFEDRVVVSATDTAQRIDELSKTVTVIDANNLDVRDVSALTDGLREVPGLRIEQFGGPGALTSIRIRGLRPEDTAVLIDGVRFRDAAATQGDATTFLSDLMITNLDRIEILRGAGSSLYGSNAVGGAINLISRPGGGRPAGSLLIEGGTLEFSRARAQLAGGAYDDRFTYSVGVSRLNVGASLDDNDRARNSAVQSRFGLRLGPANLSGHIYGANAFTSVNEGAVGIGVLPPTGFVTARPLSQAELHRYETGTPVSVLEINGANFIPSANDPDNTRKSRSLSALLNIEQRPAAGFGYAVSYHRVTTHRTFTDGPLGISGFEPTGITRAEFDGTIQTLAARGDMQMGVSQLLTAAYQFEQERYLNDSIPTNPAAKATVDVVERSHSISVQDQVSLLGGALQVAGAFRAQLFSLRKPLFAPITTAPYQGISFSAPPPAHTTDGTAAYFVSATRTKLRVHVGLGYRAPSLFERFGTSFGSRGYSVFGDPRLQPERSPMVDAGVDQDLARDRLRLSLGVFATRLDRTIVFDSSGVIAPATDPFGRSRGYRLVDGGTSRGVEITARIEPFRWIRASSSYAYTHAKPPTGNPADLPQAVAIPRHQFVATALQTISRSIQTSIDITMSGSYVAPISDRDTFVSRTYRFHGIRRIDVGASYRRPLSSRMSLRLFGKVNNLTGQAYFESGFRNPGRVLQIGTTLEF